MSVSKAFCWLLCWTLSCLSLQGVRCVAIWKFSVPRWVQNGTEDPVLLDCEYVYNEHDGRLVVKWFFNDLTEPVYQWIPELNSRQTSGILTGRLDDSYTVGGPRDSQYRALRIIRPTTEMSGLYTCVVSSMAGFDSRKQSMMVYVPAKNFTLSYVTTPAPAAPPAAASSLGTAAHALVGVPADTTSPGPGTSPGSFSGSGTMVEVHCGALGLHPRPTLRLFSITPDMRRTEVQRGRPRTRKTNGTYDIELSRSFSAEQLPQSVTFECVLEIPGTDYEVRRRTVYSPGYLYLTGGSSEIASRKSLLVVLFVLTLLKNAYTSTS
ncbi:uncharacterized protein LOC119393374 isoform X1 [Rhipicephalus sanguineus]|uniref:uncharacterized protein LOC119393374 isoform X1 n=1 Tax=Rhipicephalus sanguineus TaxID=34632 RepID=UPI001894DFC5|nr:uncharacterized protein LOC119393374 isoform X1 [Rhipicephalus sanguineus]